MSALQITWFWLIGLLLAGYVVLDGFDLGVGFWYLFTRKDTDRRALLASIMPYWDGNEVWLLTGGGAVFAAFPQVYATVFSGLYLALMLVLFALIFRAVSIEFRNQSDSPRWRGAWDIAFALGSILPALLFGVAAGNLLRGLPIDEAGNYTGTFFSLLNPYALLTGLAGLAMFATHGALFAAMKTEGDLSDRAVEWAKKAFWVYAVLLVGTVGVTIVNRAGLMANYQANPALWALPVLMLAAVACIMVFLKSKQISKAFLSSCAAILAMFATLGAAVFPNMVPSITDPALSLTLANASSSALTLKTMLILAVIGVPIVLAYTVWVHLIFRGKAEEHAGY